MSREPSAPSRGSQSSEGSSQAWGSWQPGPADPQQAHGELHLGLEAEPGGGSGKASARRIHVSSLSLLFFKFSPKDIFIDLRERGKGRERNIDVREKH